MDIRNLKIGDVANLAGLPATAASSGPTDPRLAGPWRWLGSALIHDTGRRDVVITGGRNPGDLVTCERPSGLLRPLDTASPVAQLIAAAPDLLRGCQAALAYLADPPSIYPENRAEAAEIIRAAIGQVAEGLAVPDARERMAELEELGAVADRLAARVRAFDCGTAGSRPDGGLCHPDRRCVRCADAADWRRFYAKDAQVLALVQRYVQTTGYTVVNLFDDLRPLKPEWFTA